MNILTNAQIHLLRPGVIIDHGIEVPDYDNMTSHLLGRFFVEPAGGTRDVVRALAENTRWLATGPLVQRLQTTDEINVLFDSGRYLKGLKIAATVDYWEGPGLLNSTEIQLTDREEEGQENEQGHRDQAEPQGR